MVTKTTPVQCLHEMDIYFLSFPRSALPSLYRHTVPLPQYHIHSRPIIFDPFLSPHFPSALHSSLTPSYLLSSPQPHNSLVFSTLYVSFSILLLLPLPSSFVYLSSSNHPFVLHISCLPPCTPKFISISPLSLSSPLVPAYSLIFVFVPTKFFVIWSFLLIFPRCSHITSGSGCYHHV
uniref:Uncharacterized protein n=1 Tax=Cacopsylla melanoneura TaxID=428564 RepID=A0A8D9E9H0_9HEMI